MAQSMQPKIRSLASLAGSGAIKDSVVFFSGNFLNTTLSFLAVLIVSRRLGPDGFGVIAVFNSVLVMIVGLTDLGLNTTTVRFISEYRQRNRRLAAVTMNVIVRIELLVGLLILAIGLVASHRIANLLGGSTYLRAVQFGFIAGAFSSAAAFFGPFFVAYRQYIKNAVLNLVSFVVRTGGIVWLVLASALTLNRVITLYTLVPMGFFIVGLGFIPRDFAIRTTRVERKKAYQDVVHYSKWIFLSLIVTGAISRLDVLFLTHYQGSRAAGTYYAAQQLISIMPLIITAISTVLLQRVSGQRSYMAYLRRAWLVVAAIGLLLLPIILLAPFAISLIFGSKYTAAIGPFRLLFVAQIITLVVVPASVFFLKIGQPRKISLASAAQLVTAVGLYAVLIPRFGMLGAGWAVLASSLMFALVLLVLAATHTKSQPLAQGVAA